MTAYRACRNQERRNRIAEIRTGSQFRQNGLDYLEVDPDNHRRLTLHFINRLSDVAGYAPPDKDHFRITGGARITGIRVVDPVVTQAQDIVLTVDQAGDFSVYTLQMVRSNTSDDPPVWLDPQLAEIEFSFRINCPSDFDCRPASPDEPSVAAEPVIDYLARDYDSLRRLLLDRMGGLMPGWTERHPADMGVALAELLAYLGDRLSYRQDAVATEAYLETARRRVSLRRHARLLDYTVSDGANARAWVQIAVRPQGDGLVLPGPDDTAHRPGVALLTKIDPENRVLKLDDARLESAVGKGARVFETMHTVSLYSAHNEMTFYDWANEDCRLSKGATRAHLKDNADGGRLLLCRGDVLIFEEIRSPETGLAADADPARRHAVRLTFVHPEAQIDEAGRRIPGNKIVDPLFPGQAVVEIRWHEEDALPFDLCIHAVADPDASGDLRPVCVARGNIVLADHGQSICESVTVTDEKRFRPALARAPVTQQGHSRPNPSSGLPETFDPQASARSARRWSPDTVRPAIRLLQDGRKDSVWRPRRDLLAADALAREFVVETEDDGCAFLRFGDGIQGEKPDAGQKLVAHYRIGCGTAGNIGADTIRHLVVRTGTNADPRWDISAVCGIRNPLAASGGVDPEGAEHIRRYAPRAFQIQERAVTASDYATIALRHPDIQKAAATVRWTGSWHTVYVTLDRLGGKPVDAAFIAEMKTYFDRFRMAGYDVEINGPRYVALDITCDICVSPGYFPADVQKALRETFCSCEDESGRQGFFHPDRFTFGQALYLSQFYAAAAAVDGVAAANVKKFQRLGRLSAGELAAGMLPAGRLEILRLDNDPNFPEHGKIEFHLRQAHD